MKLTPLSRCSAYRNSDCISNYVDRVRICDTKSVDSESIYSKAASQKSGWRQKSLSNIDLSLSSKEFQPGAGAFRYRDFESSDDLCIKSLKNSKNIEIQRDYEDVCNVNPKGNYRARAPSRFSVIILPMISVLACYSGRFETRAHRGAQQGPFREERRV